jgi:dihydropteroate synthase
MQAEALKAAGVRDVWLDPGFAFGKSVDDNLRLLNGLPRLLVTGHPVLISASRKGFLAEVMGLEYSQQADGLLEATIAFNTLAASLGVHVVRVHDVVEVARALRVVDAARRARRTSPE